MKKTVKKRFRVAFFGDGQAAKRSAHFIDAYDVAQLLAKYKYVIVNGGGPGVMLASTLGAASVGGRSEAVVINAEHQPTKHYEGQSEANLAAVKKIYSLKSYQGRLHKLIRLADAYIVFYGGTGTLAEMTFVWSEAKFAYPKAKPIIFYGKKWKKIITTLGHELNLEKKEMKVCYFAHDPDSVLTILNNL